MAKKYIELEKAKETFVSMLCARDVPCKNCNIINRCLLYKTFDKIPIADVAPVIHAHWDFTPAAPWYPKCSRCEYQIIMPYTDDNYPNYCPNCGAKMGEVVR